MPGGNKYCLWLSPGGEVFDRLSTIIRRLSAKHGGPDFPPHVTLLGGRGGTRAESIAKAARVAATMRPLPLQLGEIGFLDEYFRCLFAHVTLTEPMREAHGAALQAFHARREPDFMPHLSLLYGNYPRSLKEEIIAEIGPRLEIHFQARVLHLWLAHGHPRHWRRVASFPLR
jgi:2'-5' RNA ligase